MCLEGHPLPVEHAGRPAIDDLLGGWREHRLPAIGKRDCLADGALRLRRLAARSRIGVHQVGPGRLVRARIARA